MNIGSTSNYLSSLSSAQGVAPQRPPAGMDPDGDGDGSAHAGKAHRGGGGQIHQALMQALQSLGLSAPQAGSASTGQQPASSDSDGDSDSSRSSTGSVKQDMRQFMHALFQAVKSESASGAAASATDSTDPKASFGAGLSALISQVSNGSAPSGLQSAFTKLAADLQPTSATSAAGSTGATAASTTSPPSLQSLLSALQQDLGYGTSKAPSTGNLISTQV